MSERSNPTHRNFGPCVKPDPKLNPRKLPKLLPETPSTKPEMMRYEKPDLTQYRNTQIRPETREKSTPSRDQKGYSNHLSFIDPLEASSDLFEGDISGVKLTSVPEEQEEEEDSYVNENMKNAIKNTYQRWSEGEIPYVISNSFSSQERSIIR